MGGKRKNKEKIGKTEGKDKKENETKDQINKRKG